VIIEKITAFLSQKGREVGEDKSNMPLYTRVAKEVDAYFSGKLAWVTFIK
jgi:hypothetical protein